jgi:hypothetical protein
MSRAASAQFKIGIVTAMLALGAGGSSRAMAKNVGFERDLASASQSLKFCKYLTKISANIPLAYFNGTAGEAQFKKKCAQGVPTKRVVTATVLDDQKEYYDCPLSSTKAAITLCKNGGMGDNDVAYIAGPVATVISGPAFGCTISKTTIEISKAICKIQ